MIVIFTLLFLILLGIASVAIFYVFKFGRIIMTMEDELLNALEVHNRSVQTFDKLLALPMFTDSPQTLKILNEALEDIKICRGATLSIANTFEKIGNGEYSKIEYIETGEGQ